jgi:hypothetical protein
MTIVLAPSWYACATSSFNSWGNRLPLGIFISDVLSGQYRWTRAIGLVIVDNFLYGLLYGVGYGLLVNDLATHQVPTFVTVNFNDGVHSFSFQEYLHR